MASIFYLTQIQIDFGALSQLQSECQRVGIARPLIVTDAGVKAVGILDKALAALPDLPVSVFDQTPSNPTEAAVRAAAAVYRERGCDGHRFPCGDAAGGQRTLCRALHVAVEVAIGKVVDGAAGRTHQHGPYREDGDQRPVRTPAGG